MTAKNFSEMTEDELWDFIRPHITAAERDELPPDFKITCPYTEPGLPAVPDTIGWSARDGNGKLFGNYLMLNTKEWPMDARSRAKIEEILEINARQSWYSLRHPDWKVAERALDILRGHGQQETAT